MSLSFANNTKFETSGKKFLRRRTKAFTEKLEVEIEVEPEEEIEPQGPQIFLGLDAINEDGTPNPKSIIGSRGSCPSCNCRFWSKDFSQMLAHVKTCTKGRQKTLPAKKDFIVGNRKDAYFRTYSMSLKYPLVKKERLEYNVDLEDGNDRKVITDILRKHPMSRIKEEITFMQMAFKEIKFFQEMKGKLDETSFTQLFKNLRIEQYSAGQKIFGHGDIGTKFYIIIEGSTYVLLKNEGIIQTSEDNADRNDFNSKQFDDLKSALSSDISPDEKKRQVELCYPDCWIVRTLHQGESFGEIGLQKAGTRTRTASIVCQSETFVGTLTYEDYQANLAKLYERQYNEKIDFFNRIDAFTHWTRNHISSLVCHIEDVKFGRKKVILQEGEVSKYLYFVKSGEIEFRKVVDLPHDEAAEILTTLEEQDKSVKPQVVKSKKQDTIKLGKIIEGDYFGIDASLEKYPSEVTAITSSDEVTLIRISRDKFVRFVRDCQTLNKFKKHINRRSTWHSELTTKFINISVNNRFSAQRLAEWSSKMLEQKEIRPASLSMSGSILESPRRERAVNRPMTTIQSIFKPTPNSPKIIWDPNLKSTQQQNLPSPSQNVVRRPKTAISATEATREFLNSKKFFAKSDNAKQFKYGLAYQKHQVRLQKFFGSGEEKQKPEGQNSFESQDQSKETAENSLKLKKPESAHTLSKFISPKNRTTQSHYFLSQYFGGSDRPMKSETSAISFPSTPGIKLSATAAVPTQNSYVAPNETLVKTASAVEFGSENLSARVMRKSESGLLLFQKTISEGEKPDPRKNLKSQNIQKRSSNINLNQQLQIEVSSPLYTSVSAFLPSRWKKS